MAENKKGFLLYANYIGTFKQLPDDVAGRLIKHIFSYVNDENPVTDELIINVVFESIKNRLKDDLEKYILSKHDKSLSGRIGNLKRWHKDLYDEFAADRLSLQDAEIMAQNRKLSRCDDLQSQPIAEIAVKDNVSDKVIVNEKEKLKILNNFLLSEIKISDDSNFLIFGKHKIEISEKERINFKTAVWFQKLFIKNLKEKNSPSATQEKAKYKAYVDPIRLMFDVDKVTQEQMKEAHAFLSSLEGEFWKKNILSTETLRKQISKLLIQKKDLNGKSKPTTGNFVNHRR